MGLVLEPLLYGKLSTRCREEEGTVREQVQAINVGSVGCGRQGPNEPDDQGESCPEGHVTFGGFEFHIYSWCPTFA